MQSNRTTPPFFATALSAVAVLTALVFPVMAPQAEAAPTFITTAQGQGADLNVRGGNIFGSGNFGNHEVLRVRNSTDLGSARKTYLRFDLGTLPNAITKATDATLGLQIAPAEGKSAPDKVWTFRVYGLKDGAPGENWSEKTTSWNDAPANEPKSALDVTGEATPLGTFTITGAGDAGKSIAFSSPQFLRFLQSDTNGEVTLLIARQEASDGQGNDVMHIFASKESTTLGPPVLSVAYNGEKAVLPNGVQLAALPADAVLPFESDIEAFEAADRQNPPTKGGIVFVGSSSIRKWETLKQDFPGYNVLNRGFGGSHIIDSVHFAERIVTPYAPKMIVFYAGTNDLADGAQPEVLLSQYMEFVSIVRAKLPTVPIAFIAVAPAPARWGNAANIKQTNALVKQFSTLVPGLQFIDILPLMLDNNGQPRPELFVGDGIHMTPAGYAIWNKAVAPHLPKP